jgi:hypothetical protein
MPTNGFSDKAAFIWSVADPFHGSYSPNQYKDPDVFRMEARKNENIHQDD